MNAELQEPLAKSFYSKGEIAVFINFPKMVHKIDCSSVKSFFFCFSVLFFYHLSYFLVVPYLDVEKDQLPASNFLNT